MGKSNETDSRATKFTGGELNIILDYVSENMSLILAPKTKFSAPKKDAILANMTQSVNSAGPTI